MGCTRIYPLKKGCFHGYWLVSMIPWLILIDPVPWHCINNMWLSPWWDKLEMEKHRMAGERHQEWEYTPNFVELTDCIRPVVGMSMRETVMHPAAWSNQGFLPILYLQKTSSVKLVREVEIKVSCLHSTLLYLKIFWVLFWVYKCFLPTYSSSCCMFNGGHI